MAATFRANQAGIAALARTPAMRDAMQTLADRVANQARAIAPVVTGEYKASIEASTVQRDGKICGRVTAGAPHSQFLEFGTEHMDAQRILGRSLDVLRGT